MKKFFLSFATVTLLLTACNKTDVNTGFVTETSLDDNAGLRKCASAEVLEEQLKTDPSLRRKMNEVEAFTRKFAANRFAQRISGDLMIIPVVVNVLYRTDAENIALAQIKSQIDVLNEDFEAKNGDVTKIPTLFTNVQAYDTRIRFVLDTVIRKSSKKKSWGTNDAMKKTSLGGINPTSPTTKLNVWVCTIGNGILGYAQFPGGNSTTDGVVILNTAFGSREKYPGGYYISTYDLGRTASHEVGHWFNLRHIWGDATCGNDFVSDTPLHTGANYNCPVADLKSNCTGAPVMMTMNYMDYTADACMYMFSAAQKTRMQATYAVGGPRAGLR